MRRFIVTALLVIAVMLAIGSDTAWTQGAGLTTIEIRDEVRVSGVKRFGLVINARRWWGAGQIMKNMIDNPGFEAGLFGSLIHAEAGASGTRVPQAFWDTSWNSDTDGIGQPEGFWDGAEYEIVYGPAKGRTGTVTDFTHEANRNVFYLDSGGTAPEELDAFIVRREIPGVDAGGGRARRRHLHRPARESREPVAASFLHRRSLAGVLPLLYGQPVARRRPRRGEAPHRAGRLAPRVLGPGEKQR